MFIRKILDILIPPRCPNCGLEVDADNKLCACCWKEIHFTTEPFCKKCGQPLEHGMSDNQMDCQCATCFDNKPDYDGGRSVLSYDGTAKTLLLRFKHGDATYMACLFASWMKQYEDNFFKESDYLIPVPLHWTRLLKRRYNQSSLLAISLLKVLKKKPSYAPFMLRRKRRTPSQGHKTAQQRYDNVHKAFIVPDRYHAQLKGKNVLLIDDVMTTGATLQECSHTLKQAGCSKVFILTVARVGASFMKSC